MKLQTILDKHAPKPKLKSARYCVEGAEQVVVELLNAASWCVQAANDERAGRSGLASLERAMEALECAEREILPF